MSLDVFLEMPDTQTPTRKAIFVRENGRSLELTRAEWEERYPDREPVTMEVGGENSNAFDANITHNLGRMADEAGIYTALWRPEDLKITKAKDLVGSLADGLAMLKSDPERFKKLNPENGWGDYEGLVQFVESYLAACRKYPEAVVKISR